VRLTWNDDDGDDDVHDVDVVDCGILMMRESRERERWWLCRRCLLPLVGR